MTRLYVCHFCLASTAAPGKITFRRIPRERFRICDVCRGKSRGTLLREARNYSLSQFVLRHWHDGEQRGVIGDIVRALRSAGAAGKLRRLTEMN